MNANIDVRSATGASAIVSPHRTRLWARPVALGVFLLSLLGFLALLICTRWGIGASPDSVIYIGAARNLLLGNGLSVPFGNMANNPLTHYPPLYPALLAAIGTLKVDPAEAARWLNAFLFGANTILVAVVIRCLTNRTGLMAIAGAFLILISPSVLTLHAMAWSESLFIFLGFVGLLLLAQYAENASWKLLLASSSVVSLALLTRYAGVVFLVVGALGIITLRSSNIRQRLCHGLMFSSIAALPLLVWSIWNLAVAETATNRSLSFHPLGTSHLWQLLDTVSVWFLIPNSMPNSVKIGAVLTVAAGGVAALYLWQREMQVVSLRSLVTKIAGAPNLVKVLVLFITIYICFLFGSISFIDANTPLDERILSPVYVAGLILVLYGAGNFFRLNGRARPLQIALIIAGLVFASLSVYRDSSLLMDSYRNGIGFNHRVWRNSLTLTQVRELPQNMVIYSNSPEAVYLWTGRSALRLPRPVNLMEQLANANYPEELSAMKLRLQSEGGVIVFFKAVRGSSLPTEEALSAALQLMPLVDAPDGTIYALASTR